MDRNYVKGIFSIIVSAFGFACMAFFVKLSGNLPVMQKAIFRNLIAAVIAFGMLRRSGEPFAIGKGNYTTMICRCLFGLAGLICNFWVLQYLNMGDASILQKMAPFFAVMMSIVVMGEKPGKADLACVAVALAGAAFVVKPGRGLASFPALIGLFGGFCAGTAYTFVRKLGTRGVKGPVIVLCFSASSVLALLPFVMLDYHPMTMEQTACLLLAGVFASLGQFFVTAAYTYAPAKRISVFDYTQVIFAALLGFVFLREIPDAFSLTGYGIIIVTAVIKWKLS